MTVTGVPEVYEAEQVEPQSMPEGELVTVPVPVLETVRVYCGSCVTVKVCPSIVMVPCLEAELAFAVTE